MSFEVNPQDEMPADKEEYEAWEQSQRLNEFERRLREWLGDNVIHSSPHNAGAINDFIASAARKLAEDVLMGRGRA